ncbi:hypothetical protein HPB50_026639 [Hyalomma asiaticum]|uniref:Uncharacterized protein n=1 Tax=Hyalomma asiaticum TaxID=266040 RepID=A0ACB7T4J3_HYAAI|nr:hypothetical protein HPB50_026639 [Hyalomma asiaticum]
MFRPQKKWIPGIVRDARGKRMLTVGTSQGTEQRHLEQLRRRDTSPTESCGADKVTPLQHMILLQINHCGAQHYRGNTT